MYVFFSVSNCQMLGVGCHAVKVCSDLFSANEI